MNTEEIAEGLYQCHVAGERLVVEVLKTLDGQWPCMRERLMAFPLSGPPRFPYRVQELVEMKATFERLKL